MTERFSMSMKCTLAESTRPKIRIPHKKYGQLLLYVIVFLIPPPLVSVVSLKIPSVLYNNGYTNHCNSCLINSEGERDYLMCLNEFLCFHIIQTKL